MNLLCPIPSAWATRALCWVRDVAQPAQGESDVAQPVQRLKALSPHRNCSQYGCCWYEGGLGWELQWVAMVCCEVQCHAVGEHRA